MFMVVAKNGQPYAQVFTSVTLARFLAALPEKLESHLAVSDSSGQVLAGEDSDITRVADQKLTHAKIGQYTGLRDVAGARGSTCSSSASAGSCLRCLS
jgi:hypothetical protein